MARDVSVMFDKLKARRIAMPICTATERGSRRMWTG
jgi:hypothetical protein